MPPTLITTITSPDVLAAAAMSADGGTVAWMTSNPYTYATKVWVKVGDAAAVEASDGLPAAPAFRYAASGLAVSADGSTVAFGWNGSLVRWRAAARDTVPLGLAASVRSGNQLRLSSDGTTAFFESDATGLVPGVTTARVRLYARDLDAGVNRLLVGDTLDLSGVPVWDASADGERLVYRGTTTANDGGFLVTSPQRLRVVTVATGVDEVVTLPSDLNSFPFAMSSDGRQVVVPVVDAPYVLVVALPSTTTVPPTTTTTTPTTPTTTTPPTTTPPTTTPPTTTPPTTTPPPIVGGETAVRTVVPVTPQRLLDTRPGSLVGYSGPKPTAHQVVAVTVPSGNRAVALNVTGVDATAAGFVTVYPCGSDLPTASNLNLVPGVISPNAVVVGVGAGDQVCLYTDAGAHLIADLTATFPIGTLFTPVVPRRLLDTRAGSRIGYDGPTPGAGATVTVATGAAAGEAVVVNITGLDAPAAGYVTAYPCGEERPGTSNLNLRRGVISPNLAVVKAGVGGDICLYTDAGADLIADLAGTAPAGSAGLLPRTPVRLLDTRAGSRVGYDGAKPAPGSIVPVAVPAGTATAFLNVTGVDATADGYVTAYPCGGTPPQASTLNLVPGVISPNLAVVGVGAGSAVCLFTQSGTDLVADLLATAS